MMNDTVSKRGKRNKNVSQGQRESEHESGETLLDEHVHEKVTSVRASKAEEVT